MQYSLAVYPRVLQPDLVPDPSSRAVPDSVSDFGGPQAVFDCNMPDRRSLESTLDALEKRTGMRAGATVFLDRGIAFDENLSQIRQRGSHYIVAGRQSERNEWLDEREQDDDWETLDCGPSARNRFQKKSRVEVKRRRKGDLVYLLCCVFQRS